MKEKLDYSVINSKKFRWQSDWSGYEVDHDHIDVVGLYSMTDYPIDVYIDASTGEILEAWSSNYDE